MAFGNYFPATYQPYYFPQQQFANQNVNSSNMIWVSSEQDVLNYPVAPNNAVPLWDSNKSVVYLKQADASGKPSIKIYDLTERTTDVSTTFRTGSSKDTTFAAKSDVDALSSRVDEIREELIKLKKEKREINDT